MKNLFILVLLSRGLLLGIYVRQSATKVTMRSTMRVGTTAGKVSEMEA
jgi:hypothetical protein